MKSIQRLVLLGITLIVPGCGSDSPTRCALPGPGPAIYAVNNLGDTITRYDLDARVVTCHSVAVGPRGAQAIPNQAVIHDGRMWVVLSGANEIEVISLPDLSKVGRVDLGPGSNPWSIAFADGQAYVSNFLSGDIARLDCASQTAVSRSAAGICPEGLAVAGGRVFVANTGLRLGQPYAPGTVTVHDAATGAATDTLAVGTNPQAVLVDSTGIVNVLCTGDYAASFGRVFFIDPAIPAVIDSLEIGGSPGFACLGDSGRVYVTAWVEGLLVYDAVRREIIRGVGGPLLADVGLQGAAFDGPERRLYVADFDDDVIRVVSLETGALERSFPAGDGPVGCAVYRP